MWLSKMAYTPGCCSLKAWFIPVGIALVAYPKACRIISVLVGLKKGEIFWKETSNDFKSLYTVYHTTLATGYLL